MTANRATTHRMLEDILHFEMRDAKNQSAARAVGLKSVLDLSQRVRLG